MLEVPDIDITAIGARLLDDAYLAWFAAESECERALRAWSGSLGSARAASYDAYLAALDREEAAALDLERFCASSRPLRVGLAIA
jgi:hypothetical protein